MKQAKNNEVEKMVRGLRETADTGTHRKILAHLLDVQKRHQQRQTAAAGTRTRIIALRDLAQPALRRIIMTSPFTKLAAAVMVVAAVSLVVLDKSASPAYGLDNLPAAFDQARVIHVEGWQYFPRLPLSDGSARPPVPIKSWIDLDNGRMRQMQAAVSQTGRFSSIAPPDVNTAVTVTEMVCDGSYLMTLNHAAKTATFTRISAYGRQWLTYRQSRLLWGQLCVQPAELEHFQKCGRDDIDGRPYDIWELNAASGMGTFATGGGGAAGGGSHGNGSGSGSGQGHVEMAFPTFQSRLWLAADTGRLGRAQVLSQVGDGHWLLEQDYHTIDYDVPIPADTFVTEPPAGYTVTNSKQTAPVMELFKGSVRCGSLEFNMRASFTLSDGSVIVGWQSLDQGDKGSQEPLFANLFFGGPLPKLPVELFSLTPAGVFAREEYQACHLGRTVKAGQLIEWSLYVPRKTPPASVKYLGYNAALRFNVTTPPAGSVGMTVPYGVPIKTPGDFDQWVRGAMAELSDTSTAPADVTYQKVSDLARQTSTPTQQ